MKTKMFLNILLGLFFVFVVIFIVLRFARESSEENLLKSSLEATAILRVAYQGTSKTPASGNFSYKLNGKQYEFSQSGDYYKSNKIGDTVLIKYAIKDPSVARVIDRYYMKKYQNLKDSSVSH